MKLFRSRTTELQTSIKSLRQFSNDSFYTYYKNRKRFKDVVPNRDRYPELKITDDIFSLSFWVRDRNDRESQVYLDGDIFLNSAHVHSITLEGEYFDTSIIKEFEKTFKRLSFLTRGVVSFDTEQGTVGFEQGKRREGARRLDDDENLHGYFKEEPL